MISSFNNFDFDTEERISWSLPVRMDGMGLTIPSKIDDYQYPNHVESTSAHSQSMRQYLRILNLVQRKQSQGSQNWQ